MLTRFSQSLLRPGGGWAQPFCRAFELHCHFVVKENPFCRMGGLVLLQNEWLRPHRGNWKGDVYCMYIIYIYNIYIYTSQDALSRRCGLCMLVCHDFHDISTCHTLWLYQSDSLTSARLGREIATHVGTQRPC